MPKRHPSLIPLSRDHHDGLMLALRLRQGTKASLKDWSHDPAWQAEYITNFYDRHLVPHFEAEERALFPVMKEHAGESLKTIETLLAQHREMKRRVERLKREKGLPKQLEEFGELLNEHIRIEEDELFPTYEKRVPSEVAAIVGTEIKRIVKHSSRRK